MDLYAQSNNHNFEGHRFGGWNHNVWQWEIPWLDLVDHSLVEEERILRSIVFEVHLEYGREDFWL